MLVFVAHGENMSAHRRCRARAIAAQDSLDYLIMLDMRFRQPAEIAKLGTTKRPDPRPSRKRHVGKIAIVRAGIDAGMKSFIDLVVALRIAALN